MVFTSGIVDDALPVGAVSSQYYLSSLLVGVEPGGVVVGGGVDTLLSPEASAVRLVSLALQDRVVTVWRCGLGGCGSCELDSGREHLCVNRVPLLGAGLSLPREGWGWVGLGGGVSPVCRRGWLTRIFKATASVLCPVSPWGVVL